MVPRLAVAMLIVVAGCSGPGGSGTSGPSGATGTTDHAMPSTVTPVIPNGATEANTVAYAELSETEKRAFDAAVSGGAEFLPPSVHDGYFHPGLADPFRDNEYVLKNGTYFELAYQSGDLYSSRLIEANKERPPEDANVVAFDNLSPRSQQLVRSAIESGSYSTGWSRSSSLPGDLSDVKYVRYSGSVYRLRFGVADAWVQVWTAERVE